MQKIGHVVGVVFLIGLVAVGTWWFMKPPAYDPASQPTGGRTSIGQDIWEHIAPMVPERIGGSAPNASDVLIDQAESVLVWEDVYTVAWQGSVQYLNDARYSYEERLQQLVALFEDNSSLLRESDYLSADPAYLSQEKFSDQQLGDERYLTRRVISTKYEDIRIRNGEELGASIIAQQDVDIIPDEGDLVIRPTGNNPLFLFAYTTPGSLAIDIEEVGGEGVWLYSDGKPEVILFSIQPGNHIKETSINIKDPAVNLYTTSQYGYYQKHMGGGGIPSLRAQKKHTIELFHGSGLRDVVSHAYVVYHDHLGYANSANTSRDNLQKEFGWDWVFADMFYPAISDSVLMQEFENTSAWTHRLLDKPTTTTQKQKTTFTIEIPATLASDDDYFSLIFQDSHDYRYTVPFRVLPDDEVVVRTDELTTPTWQYRDGNDTSMYPRMMGTLTFPRGIVTTDLQDAFDTAWGEGVVEVAMPYYDMVSSEKEKAFTSFTLSYTLPPNSSRSDTLQIKDAYGDDYAWNHSISVGEIPKYHQLVTLQGTEINLLPQEGYWGKHLQVIEKNVPMLQLKFTPCSLRKNPSEEISYQEELSREERLLYCDMSKSLVRTYDVADNANRREETEHTIEIPEEFAAVPAFQVSVENDLFDGWQRGRNHTSYFFKSAVGLYTKLDEQKLYVWGWDLMKGELVSTGTVTLRTQQGLPETIALDKDGVSFDITQARASSQWLTLEYNSADSSPSYLVVSPSRGGYLYTNNGAQGAITSWIDTAQLYQKPPRYRDSDSSLYKLYGYTDRGLYRPGDTIYFAGFTRDMTQVGWDVSVGDEFLIDVTLTSLIDNSQVAISQQLTVDEFGGFAGELILPTEAGLGTYLVDYMITQGPRQASYQHTILVKEFTKPNFEVRGELETQDALSVQVDPRYYFGSPVVGYDVSLAATLIPQERCRDCRWYSNETDEGYTNFQFGTPASARVDRSLNNLQEPATILLFDKQSLPDPTASYDLVTDVIVIDKKTGERITKQLTATIEPSTKIYLPGEPIEWRYELDDQEDMVLEITDSAGNVDKTVASWWYMPYGHEVQEGVDGEIYTIYGRQMEFITSGSVRDSVTYPSMKNPGTYFLRVQSFDAAGDLLATNEKRIEFYGGESAFVSYYGELQNNTIWHVAGPSKSVEVGDQIKLDLTPYVTDAKVIVTVERGNRILDVFERTLSGEPLMIPAKETYYPNVHISAHTVIGEETPLLEERKEPRLLHGYAEVSINRNDTELHINLSTDKEVYKPGDKLQLAIETTTPNGDSIPARVSVAIIDKALVDLYTIIKEPLPYFFNKMGTSVGSYANMRFLYQMLRVYVTPGDKGGGGSDVSGRFGDRRENFVDVAFWQADVITKDGEAMVEVTLPDNLTTRVIDVIGISQKTHLGTTMKEIVADKPLKIQAYLPQYITLGDEITFPVTAFGRKGDVHNDLAISGTMSYAGRTLPISFVPSRHQDTQWYGAIHLPGGFQTGNELHVALAVMDVDTNEVYDEVLQEIPVRTQGFIQRTTSLGFASSGSLVTAISGSIVGGDVRLSVSTFPLQRRRDVMQWLLFYPYGCAEQRMSQLLPVLYLPDLERVGVVDETIFQDGQVRVMDRGNFIWMKRDDVITNALIGLFPYQSSDGGFSYWTTPPQTSDYGLSLAVWGGLLQAYAYGYIQPQTPWFDNIKKLERYLLQPPADWSPQDKDNSFMMMARYAAQTGFPVGADQQATVDRMFGQLIQADTISSVDHFAALLTLGVYAHQGNTDRAVALVERIDWDHLSYPTPRNQAYRNPITLHAVALQSLSALDQKNEMIAQTTNDVLLSLLKLQDGSGLWGRSTQANMQVFMGLSKFILARGPMSEENISCKVTLGDQTFDLSNNNKEPDITKVVPIDVVDGKVNSSWTCDAGVIIDQTVSWLPEDVTSIKEQLIDMDLLETQRSLINETSVGSVDILTSTFVVDNDVEQLAVEMYLPATHRFIATTSAEFVGSDALPFDVEGSYECNPRHFEVRYDRLFLYYETMEAGTRCEISIEAVKSLTGKARIMPTRVYEMYRARVYGNTAPFETINK